MLETVTATGAVIGYFIVFIFSKHESLSLLLNVLLTLTATLVIIDFKIRARDFYFLPLTSRKERDDWIGDGTFHYDRTQKAYTITNSHWGFIYSKCLDWSDYEFDFRFKILYFSIGAIVRATDLSNKIMLQILERGVKPHIFINGFWKAWEPEEAQLEFTRKLVLDDWYDCKLTCDKTSIRIRIFDLQGIAVCDREWRIPSGQITLFTQAAGQNVPTPIPYSINLEFGTVGFRNNGTEKAVVKEVLIDKKL